MNTINPTGTNFNLTMFNENMDNIQAEFELGGTGVISGLIPGSDSLLTTTVSTGAYLSEYPRTVAVAIVVTLGASQNNYLWLDNTGSVSVTTTNVSPSNLHVGLGMKVTDATHVTATDWSSRQLIPSRNNTLRLSRNKLAVARAGGLNTVAPSEYDTTLLYFTGVLTSNDTEILPNIPGAVWFIGNKTTGAFSLSLKTPGGATISITQNFGCLVACDGSNIIKIAAEIAV